MCFYPHQVSIRLCHLLALTLQLTLTAGEAIHLRLQRAGLRLQLCILTSELLREQQELRLPFPAAFDVFL